MVATVACKCWCKCKNPFNELPGGGSHDGLC